MTLPVSGPISLSQVNVELGLSATASINMNASNVRTLFGKPSGTISMSDGYGKSNQFAFTISSNQINADLRTLAVNAGWNGTSKVVATINSGVYMYSNSTGSPALTISGSLPGSYELINNGIILGRGGNGGQGGSYSMIPTVGGGGGTALSVSVAGSVRNNNIIAGGGGGGGGAGLSYGKFQDRSGGGGGGGIGNSSGGAGGSNPNTAGSGGGGTLTSAGNGGAGAFGNNNYGGNGGGYGSAGASGVNGGSYNGSYPAQTQNKAGGAGGAAVTGNSNITWLATGNRYGGIS